MSFNHFLQTPHKVLDLYAQFHRHKVMSIEVVDEKEYKIHGNQNPDCPQWVWDAYLRVVASQSVAAHIEAYCLASALGGGIRLLSPTARQCEMLEQIELSFDCADYAQPYPTMVIDLPRDWLTDRLVPGSYFAGAVHGPSFLILAWVREVNALLALVAMRQPDLPGWQANEAGLTWAIRLLPGKPLEQSWVHANQGALIGDSMTAEEAMLGDKVIRLGCNAMMLAMARGLRSTDDDRTTRRRQELQRRSSGQDERSQASRRDLRLIPWRYDFTQRVTIRKEGSAHNPVCDATGRIMSPHWRSGHWRMQPYGPQGSLRKRILIDPIFVNEHLFLGNQARVDMTIK